jgi:hypothetical protein
LASEKIQNDKEVIIEALDINSPMMFITQYINMPKNEEKRILFFDDILEYSLRNLKSQKKYCFHNIYEYVRRFFSENYSLINKAKLVCSYFSNPLPPPKNPKGFDLADVIFNLN